MFKDINKIMNKNQTVKLTKLFKTEFLEIKNLWIQQLIRHN